MLKTILDAVREAGSRDVSTKEAKKNYAERLSRALATVFANALRKTFSGIMPDEAGQLQESRARTSKGVKKLDVNYSTPELGLGLGVSIKTINFRDASTKRYTKNYTRVDNELRAEAKDYHQRQPFAVMVAVVFLPLDACEDGGREPSSFGAAVKLFRHRAGRTDPSMEQDLFERLFVALYDPAATSEASSLRAVDVMTPPPKHGAPDVYYGLKGLVAEIQRTYDDRNNPPFVWSDE